MSMSADIHPIAPSSASPAVEGERGRPQCKLQRGRGPSGAQRYLAVHRQTPKRWRGSEPLDAEQMTVLSREQIRGMFSLPFPSPSAWLDAVVSPQICSIRHWYPHVGKQDLSLRQHKTCRSGKKGYPVQYNTPLLPFSVDSFLVAIPPKPHATTSVPSSWYPVVWGGLYQGCPGLRDRCAGGHVLCNRHLCKDKGGRKEDMLIEINEAAIMKQHPTLPAMSNRQADQTGTLLGVAVREGASRSPPSPRTLLPPLSPLLPCPPPPA